MTKSYAVATDMMPIKSALTSTLRCLQTLLAMVMAHKADFLDETLLLGVEFGEFG